jgi:hypothetical protein
VNGVDVLVESVAPSQLPARTPESKRMSWTAALAKRLGLRLVASDALTIRRRRCGRGFAYYTTNGQPIRNRAEVRSGRVEAERADDRCPLTRADTSRLLEIAPLNSNTIHDGTTGRPEL